MSLSFIVTGTIWRWMLQPQGGVNQAPTLLGAALYLRVAEQQRLGP